MHLYNTSTHEREFENSNLGNFSNLYLKIQMKKTKFEFFSIYLELI
jgi:hypothetical protein